MDNRCFNLFIYVQGDVVTSLGVAVHEVDGDDAARLRFLQSQVSIDCNAAQQFAVTEIRWSQYQAMMRMGSHLRFFEPLFEAIEAPEDPLVCITPIVDGYPAILAVTDLGPLNLAEIGELGPLPSGMVDYLKAYVVDGGFDIPRLLNDDYLDAIRLLFSARKFVSCSKLLMSFIDTLAFIEYGDQSRSFQRWLETYADLNRLGVSADELWEYRNSVLHMTNLSSRKVLSGTVSAVFPFVGPEEPRLGGGYLNLLTLIKTAIDAVPVWIESYNANPAKFLTFIERYDLIISDARVGIVAELDDPAIEKK